MKTLSPRYLVAADDLVAACVAAVKQRSHGTECEHHHGGPCTCWLALARHALAKAGVEVE